MAIMAANAMKQGSFASNKHALISAENIAELFRCLNDVHAALQHAIASTGSQSRMGNCFSGCIAGTEHHQKDSKVHKLKIECSKLLDSLAQSQTEQEMLREDLTQKIEHAKVVASQQQVIQDVTNFIAGAQSSLLDAGSPCLPRPPWRAIAALLTKLQEMKLLLGQLEAGNSTPSTNLGPDQVQHSEFVGTDPAPASEQKVQLLGESPTKAEATLPGLPAIARNSKVRFVLPTKPFDPVDMDCAESTQQQQQKATVLTDEPESKLSAIKEEYNEPSTFEGPLLKQSPALHRFGGYQQRFVKLNAGQIAWSLVDSDGSAGQLKGYADLAGNICYAEEGNECQFIVRPQEGSWQGFNTFKAGRKDRSLRFDVSGSTHTLEQWITAVRAHIAHCELRFGQGS